MNHKRIKLALAIHNHQPVGNFDFVFAEAFEKSYQPFFEIVERHPSVRLAQHFTGPLLEWLQEHKPDFLSRMRALVNRGQIEMISGGFYEPILTVIPERDRIGQISKMNRFLEDETGYTTKGMWLAERIWEPNLPSLMSKAGLRYVVLDDSHFKGAGLDDNDLYGYYVTEDQGNCVALFPIIEQMRYNIPFVSPEETIEFLRRRTTEDGQNLVVYADDGEKFGSWPGTYKHCYENNWLENFFQALEANSDWIELVHLSEALNLLKPLGRIYLPTASYREMMEWAMPTDAIHQYEKFEARLKEQQLHERFKVFVKGGFWRNFMAKYPEANNMHKRMLSISKRLAELEPAHGSKSEFGDAQNLVWAAQCNCPYWHGIFGGLYLNHLRYATYSRLIKADAMLDSLEQVTVSCFETDFDSDGADEVVVSTKELWLCFAPQQGGSLIELDYKPAAINLLDTLARREEAYHERLRAGHISTGGERDGGVTSIHDAVSAKEAGLEKRLHYDWYRRLSFIDHLLGKETTLDRFFRCDYEEAGDFVTTPYSYELIQSGEEVVELLLGRDGFLRTDDVKIPVRVQKRFRIPTYQNSSLTVLYEITNLDDTEQEFRFGPELNFALLAGDAPDRYYHFPDKSLADRRLCSIGEVEAVRELSLLDEWLGLKIGIKLEDPATVWRFPIETISQSEGGFERVYQSSVVVPLWSFRLAASGMWRQTIELCLSRLPPS